MCTLSSTPDPLWPPPNLLATGEFDLPEFQPDCLGGEPPWTRCPWSDVLNQWSSDQFDALIVAIDRPGRVTSEQIQAWRDARPDRPIVSLLSSHCEGEPRTRQGDQPTTNIYWHKWAFEFAKFQRQWGASGTSDWHRAIGRSAVDLRANPEPGQPVDCGSAGLKPLDCLVGVSARTQLAYETLAEPLEQMGGQVDWIRDTDVDGPADRSAAPASMDALVVDADSLDSGCRRRLERLRRSWPAVPLVLILGWPRAEEVRAARTLGVDLVASKPLESTELAWCLQRLLPADSQR